MLKSTIFFCKAPANTTSISHHHSKWEAVTPSTLNNFREKESLIVLQSCTFSGQLKISDCNHVFRQTARVHNQGDDPCLITCEFVSTFTDFLPIFPVGKAMKMQCTTVSLLVVLSLTSRRCSWCTPRKWRRKPSHCYLVDRQLFMISDVRCIEYVHVCTVCIRVS